MRGLDHVLFVGTLFICFTVSFFFRENRLIGFIALMVFAYLAGDANPVATTDYSVYWNHYNMLGWETSPFEKGYTEFSLLFSNYGFNYAQFRLIFAFLAFIILFISVCMFTKNVALFAGLYGITVLFNDATQIRNLMMIALVILGTALMSRENIAVKIGGVITLLVATQFHDLGFVFLIILGPLGFIKIEILRKYYKYVVYMLFGLGIIFTSASSASVVQLFSSFLIRFSSRSDSASNVITSFGRGNSTSTTIMVWLMLILFSLALTMLVNSANRLGMNQGQLKYLFVGSAIAMLVAFLIVLAPDYSRISRNAFLFFLILLSKVVEEKKKIKISEKNIAKIFLVLSVLVFTTYENTVIWGPTYIDSIPYLAKIKK